MKNSDLKILLATTFLVGCSSNPVHVEPVKEVPGETIKVESIVEKPIPTSWQLAQFEAQWSAANSSQSQLKVLKDLQIFAAPGFDVWGMWNGFAQKRYLWPSPESLSVHQELLGLQRLSCDAPSVNAFATFALAVAQSSQPYEIREGYRSAAFGSGRLCSVPPSLTLSLENLEWLLRLASSSGPQGASQVVEALDLVEKSARIHQSFDNGLILLSDEALVLLEELSAKTSLFGASASIDGARLVSLSYALSRISGSFDAVRDSILNSAFRSANSLKVFIEACDASAECRFSDVLRAWASQNPLQLEALGDDEVMARVEIISQVVMRRELSDILRSYDELRAFLTALNVAQSSQQTKLSYYYKRGAEALDRWSDAFHRRSEGDRTRFADWLVSRRHSKEPMLDSWILSTLIEVSKWETRVRLLVKSPSSESSWLRWRNLMRLPATDRVEWSKRKNSYCKYLESIGLNGGDLSSEDLKSQLISHEGLQGGCWRIENPSPHFNQATSIEIASRRILASAESVISVEGISLALRGDESKLGIVDLSSQKVLPQHQIDRENSLDRVLRDSIIFPILFVLDVPGNSDSREDCKAEGSGIFYSQNGTDQLKRYLKFCPGQHMSVFHFPVQIAQDAPDLEIAPEPAPSGGDLDLTGVRKVFETLQFVSFGTQGQLPYPAELGGRTDRSYALSAFGNPETEQASLKSFVSSYQHLVMKEEQRLYFHERLMATELQQLLSQAFVNSSPEVRVVVPAGYLDLLHHDDRMQVISRCGGDDAESLRVCFSKLSPAINQILNRVLRMSPDDYNIFKRFDDPLVSKVGFKGEDGSDFFDSRDSVFLYGGRNGNTGPAGLAGEPGELKVNSIVGALDESR